MEGADFHISEVKQNAMKEYLSRVQKILNANLPSDSMMTVICTYADPILCYTSGIMTWMRAELHKLDSKTHQLLTTHGFHHPKSSIHRLYLH
eukprot:5777610-Ditylum_brightwellii.AAC.1